MTSPVVTPIDVVIVSTQYTDGLDPMIIQVVAKDSTHPLLGTTKQVPAGQRAVAGVATDAPLATVDWADAECRAFVVAYFAAVGLAVNIVPNVQPVPVGVTPAESMVTPAEGAQP